MCNFNKQEEETKAFIALFLQKSAQSIGGVNFFLALIESMKENRPNALLKKESKVISQQATISWNKVVFKDKYEVLEAILLAHKSAEKPDFNILAEPNQKRRKKILNMVKTLAPINFIVKPNDASLGGGFEFKVFEKIEEDYVKINPIFVAMFFCSTEFTKKALKYSV
jgi:uncharacterized protein YebE (UPF0316 family)